MTLDVRGEGRVALVTGGASGIGRVLCEAFLEAGYAVAPVDFDAPLLEEAAEHLRALGGEVEPVRADVRRESEVAAAVERVVERWGRLDVLLNNAGVAARPASVEDLDEEEVDRVLAVNLKGGMLASKHAVRAMRATGGGVILNLASISAQLGAPDDPAYAASKAGVIAVTRSLARRVGRFNIRVNAINPGSTTGTHLTRSSLGGREPSKEEQVRMQVSLIRKIPLGRPGRPRDIANVALFLASPLAAHVHGAVLTVDGGESLGAA